MQKADIERRRWGKKDVLQLTDLAVFFLVFSYSSWLCVLSPDFVSFSRIIITDDAEYMCLHVESRTGISTSRFSLMSRSRGIWVTSATSRTVNPRTVMPTVVKESRQMQAMGAMAKPGATGLTGWGNTAPAV